MSLPFGRGLWLVLGVLVAGCSPKAPVDPPGGPPGSPPPHPAGWFLGAALCTRCGEPRTALRAGSRYDGRRRG